MRRVSIWLDKGPKKERDTFRAVAEKSIFQCTNEIYTVKNGVQLVDLGKHLTKSVIHIDNRIDFLVIASHGGTTWLLNSQNGVTTGQKRNPGQVTVQEFVDAWYQALDVFPIISLAACLCSRSPRWYLKSLGRLTSDWGPRAYQSGGQFSIASRIRDELWWQGRYADVRGHRAAGHASHLPLLASHEGPAGEPCKTLFQECFPSMIPTIEVRRKWVNLVKGKLAERWLLGDDSVVEEIRVLWKS